MDWVWTDENRALTRAHYPAERGPPGAGVFELGLAFAGATSTAAYSAGVLDFLFEALDAWQQAKDEGRNVPAHTVLVRTMVGTSGGGMALAIAAASAGKGFPPVRSEDVARAFSRDSARSGEALARLKANPLFATWVLGIDFIEGIDPDGGAPLPGLATKRRSPPPSAQHASLFNCEAIENLATSAVRIGRADETNAIARAWLADPREVRLTVTNLNGVPFSVPFGGATLKQVFMASRDHMAFAIRTGGGRPEDLKGIDAAPPDCIVLDLTENRAQASWRALSLAAMATGALPIALQTREIAQDRIVYTWRGARMTKVGDEEDFFAVPPMWLDASLKTDTFFATDGGFTHDPPFEYTRRRLAGSNGRNKRGGHEADRAVILIDPLLGGEEPRKLKGVLDTLLAMVMAPVEQSRMDAADVLALANDQVYSRFMIAPSREAPKSKEQLNGSRALPSSGMHALLGFASRAYRAHDFLLGRRNAQRFLRHWFVVPGTNPLYSNAAFPFDWEITGEPHKGAPQYQIIPLCGAARDEVPLPKWPSGELERYGKSWSDLEKGIHRRSRELAGALVSEFKPNGFLGGALKHLVAKPFGAPLAGSWLASKLMDGLGEAVDRVNSGQPSVTR